MSEKKIFNAGMLEIEPQSLCLPFEQVEAANKQR